MTTATFTPDAPTHTDETIMARGLTTEREGRVVSVIAGLLALVYIAFGTHYLLNLEPVPADQPMSPVTHELPIGPQPLPQPETRTWSA